MSSPYYPGHPMLTGSITSCPPPQDCCCEDMWEIRPGDTVPRAIDVTGWMKSNLGEGKYSLDDVLTKLTITDLDTPATSWPAIAQPPVVLPVVATGYFTIKTVAPFNDGKRQGYALDVAVDATAPMNARLRLDYQFTVNRACGEKYVGNGCIIIFVRKCFTGMA